MKIKSLLCCLTLSLTSLFACSTPSTNSANGNVNQKDYDPRAANSATGGKSSVAATALSRELAWMRSRQVAQVSYVLWFGIDEEHEDYDGRAVVRFELRDLHKSLQMPDERHSPKSPADNAPNLYKELKDYAQTIALDFEGNPESKASAATQIRSITVNGVVADLKEVPGKRGARYDGHRIYFHASELSPSGANRIEIAFSHPFSTDGYGFHRFRDPVDKQVYLYTNFEPYGAHRMFPCFDQPDLKASFELTVEAPQEWQIISNTLERDVTTVDGRKSWAFPPSPVISPYIFALHAGDFQTWKADANGTPMRLFARKSLKPYIDASLWFDATRRGLEYYGEFFGYPYPYSKFDQILVPDFNAGAMENVAAITYSERFVRRTRMTLDDKRDVASVILHEMAHQWFGDLVTMKWWNGLWLNESFATFMSTQSMANATDYPGAWLDFSASKERAYREDQYVTTHPIEVAVSDTDQAETMFDGISYNKGAAVLKQLMFYLGEDDFREGLQRYFQKFALRNTTTHDFMKMLGEASGKDLSKWQKTWLQTAGLNRLTADWACGADGRIAQFNLLQSPPDNSTELRPHKTQIALYDLKGTKLQLRKKDVLIATYADKITPVPEAIGKLCPAFVYPNHEDYDYAKVALDPVSLATVSKERGIATFESALQRQMIWMTLWQMVTDGQMRATDFAEAVLEQGLKETNPDLLTRILAVADTTALIRSRSTSVRITLLGYLTDAQRQAFLAKLEPALLSHLHAAPGGSDEQRIWLDAFLHVAQSPESVAFVQALLKGEKRLPGFTLQAEDRWQLLTSLAASGAPDASELLTAELARDSTDMGQKAFVQAQASIPTPAVKQEWWHKFAALMENQPGAIPIQKARQALLSFNSFLHPELTAPYVDAFFAQLPKLGKLPNPEVTHYYPGLYPGLCEQRIVDMTTHALDSIGDLPPTVVKSLKISRQEIERCIRARTMGSSGNAK